MSVPEIAVVIPTRRREARLAFALEALAAQSLARERFEVIVVRDADAREPLAPIPDGLRARYMRAPSACGPVTKRNLGWRATDAPLVAFTDDDCRPAPGWLEALLEADAGPAAVLQGRTEPDPDERHLHYGLARTVQIIGPSDWFETCNIAYPTELLRRVGGFDEQFESVCDDTDLGRRALAAGARRIYVDDARVWHAVMPRTLGVAIRETRRFETAPLVFARHPEQREALFGRYFLRPTHATLALAIAGALVFRHRPVLAALAALPYIDPFLSWRSLPPRILARVAIHLPVRALVDAAELVAILRGALRYRTPLV